MVMNTEQSIAECKTHKDDDSDSLYKIVGTASAVTITTVEHEEVPSW